MLWPIWIALLIASAGTYTAADLSPRLIPSGLLLGELLSYWLTLSFGFKKAHQMASTKLFAACIYYMLSGEAKPSATLSSVTVASEDSASTLRAKWNRKRRQFGMMMLIRLSIVPGHLSSGSATGILGSADGCSTDLCDLRYWRADLRDRVHSDASGTGKLCIDGMSGMELTEAAGLCLLW